MSRTYKDREDHIQYRKRREPALNRRYLSFLQNGCDCAHEYFSDVERGCLVESDSEHCPACGSETEFENGFMVCNDCGWVDFGDEAIPPKEAA